MRFIDELLGKEFEITVVFANKTFVYKYRRGENPGGEKCGIFTKPNGAIRYVDASLGELERELKKLPGVIDVITKKI